MDEENHKTGTRAKRAAMTPTSHPVAAAVEARIAPTATTPPATALDLQPGARIRQYELIRELGRGGMGIVFAARDLRLGRRVAIKFLRTTTREVAERFLVEARATARCSHDNIVIIHEVDEHAGIPYMVLEFLEGKTLRAVMLAQGEGRGLPASRTVELMLPVARALARAHDLGIVHRDLKPDNVFVTLAGQVKVLDFGIAKALGAIETESIRPVAVEDLELTQAGAMLGTLPYMAPEQMECDVDHRIDLFAAGVIMFELLAGRHPIQPFTSEALYANLVDDDPMPAIRGVVRDVPADLAEVVDHCLRKPRDTRTATALELARALEALLPDRRGRRLADGESPYPGLTTFQEADANRFFGRGRDIARMVTRIRERPLTGVVGPSGVGKSSFVRAGIVPALKASGERWEILTLRPGRQPMAALARIADRSRAFGDHPQRPTGQRPWRVTDHTAMIDRFRSEPGHLGALLRARARADGHSILLFVDQLEELYTLVPDAGERRAFTTALSAVADDAAAPLRVVVAMRADLLDRIAEDSRFAEELARGLALLAPPDREGLREALVAPIELAGYRFESPDVVGEMLDALAGTQGALPLLQFAAAKLWDGRDRDRRMLTAATYHAIGGVSGALATHADEVIASLSAPSRQLAQRMFRRLVTPERTRALVELGELEQIDPGGDRDEAKRVIDQLVAARLLVVQTHADAASSVELVHESLIDRWPMLQRWLDEDHEDTAVLAQLAAAAKQWDAKGRPTGLLWTGDAMEEARRWHALRPRVLGERDRAFLDAVFALARRGRRARRIALVGAFALLASVAAVASVAYVRVRAAERVASAEVQRASVALAGVRAAETRRHTAEYVRARAEGERAVAEEERTVAEADRVRAEDAVKAKSFEVARGEAELAKRNAELESALELARAARDRAERATAEARRASDEVKLANAKLADALAAERARVKVLEDEKRKP